MHRRTAEADPSGGSSIRVHAVPYSAGTRSRHCSYSFACVFFFFFLFRVIIIIRFVLISRFFFFFFTFRQTVKAVNRPVANGLVVVAVPRPRGRVVRALSDPGGLNRTNKLQCISSNVIPVLRIATIL